MSSGAGGESRRTSCCQQFRRPIAQDLDQFGFEAVGVVVEQVLEVTRGRLGGTVSMPIDASTNRMRSASAPQATARRSETTPSALRPIMRRMSPRFISDSLQSGSISSAAS